MKKLGIKIGNKPQMTEMSGGHMPSRADQSTQGAVTPKDDDLFLANKYLCVVLFL